MNKYGKPLIGMALGDQRLFTGADSSWETSWEPSVDTIARSALFPLNALLRRGREGGRADEPE